MTPNTRTLKGQSYCGQRGTILFGQRGQSRMAFPQAIGNNYNQTVKAVKSNFGEKRAFALLRNLEKATIDLVVLSKRIIMLTREFEEKYLIKRKKEEQQNGS